MAPEQSVVPAMTGPARKTGPSTESELRGTYEPCDGIPVPNGLSTETGFDHLNQALAPTEILPGHLDRGRDSHVLAAPRTDPDGHLLVHPVLISDDWRQSDPRDKDGVLAVEGAIGQPEREYVPRRSGGSGCGGEVFATTARLAAPGIRRDCRGSPVPHSS